MPILLHCRACGNPFERYPADLRKGGGKFCSMTCRGVGQSNGLTDPSEKTCVMCGEGFSGRTNGLRHCSLFCRFIERVDATGRWIPDGSRYGGLRVDGKMRGAHVVSFYLDRGRWPTPGLFVLHKNHDGLCVDPSQLYEGTHRQNMDDMVRAGRASHAGPTNPARGDANGSRLYPERLVRGEAVNTSKLTSAEVSAIRIAYAGGETQVALAEQFGVGQSAISCIVLRKTWKDLP